MKKQYLECLSFEEYKEDMDNELYDSIFCGQEVFLRDIYIDDKKIKIFKANSEYRAAELCGVCCVQLDGSESFIYISDLIINSYPTYVIEFLIYHEIGHIMNNHPELYTNTYQEIEYDPYDTEGGVIMKEHHADLYAAKVLGKDAVEKALITLIEDNRYYQKYIESFKARRRLLEEAYVPEILLDDSEIRKYIDTEVKPYDDDNVHVYLLLDDDYFEVCYANRFGCVYADEDAETINVYLTGEARHFKCKEQITVFWRFLVDYFVALIKCNFHTILRHSKCTDTVFHMRCMADKKAANETELGDYNTQYYEWLNILALKYPLDKDYADRFKFYLEYVRA